MSSGLSRHRGDRHRRPRRLLVAAGLPDPASSRPSTTSNYVDDHALAQITAALPLLGLPRDEQMRITRGDGEQIPASGFDDPQAMRMILLQILTGRRASEIRPCEFDCLSPATGRAAEAAQGEADRPVPLRPKQDRHRAGHHPRRPRGRRDHRGTAAWVRDRFPGSSPGTCSFSAPATGAATSPTRRAPTTFRLREFSDIVQVTDSKGRPVRLSHTHRFRHTKLTRLAELGLPIHVLQRYAGHATPTMSMHYIAQREEHAEQAFLATVKLRADGTRVALLPRGPRQPCTCSTAPTGSCPTAGACCPRCRPATRATPA